MSLSILLLNVTEYIRASVFVLRVGMKMRRRVVEDQFGLVEVCPCDSVSFWLCQKSCSGRISKWTTCTECKSITAACLMQSESERVFLIICMRVSVNCVGV